MEVTKKTQVIGSLDIDIVTKFNCTPPGKGDEYKTACVRLVKAGELTMGMLKRGIDVPLASNHVKPLCTDGMSVEAFRNAVKAAEAKAIAIGDVMGKNAAGISYEKAAKLAKQFGVTVEEIYETLADAE